AKVLADYKALEVDALNQYINLTEQYKDAYNELILFPIRALCNIYALHYAYAMNENLASKNDAKANEWAAKARMYYDRDSILCYNYNHKIAGGKWNHMMDQLHIGYTSWQEPGRRYFPQPKYVNTNHAAHMAYKEHEGVISMEAINFNSCHPATDAKDNDNTACWKVIKDYGKTAGAVALMPYTANIDGANIEYNFITNHTGEYDLYLYLAPTFPFNGTHTMNLCVDDGQLITLNVNQHKGDQNYEWEANRINLQKTKITIKSKNDNRHTLRISPLSKGIVIEKIEIDLGGRKPSYLGTPESPRVPILSK
ncbi:MAG: glycosyhydrolase, partial [Bacteroidaceae bacterium]|nr:glycosyhydrolase [Bacteroidaceae bacterium]